MEYSASTKEPIYLGYIIPFMYMVGYAKIAFLVAYLKALFLKTQSQILMEKFHANKSRQEAILSHGPLRSEVNMFPSLSWPSVNFYVIIFLSANVCNLERLYAGFRFCVESRNTIFQNDQSQPPKWVVVCIALHIIYV